MCTSTVRSSTRTLAGHSRCSNWARENTLSGSPMKNASSRVSVWPSEIVDVRRTCALVDGIERQRAETEQRAAAQRALVQQRLDPLDHAAHRDRPPERLVDRVVSHARGSTPRARQHQDGCLGRERVGAVQPRCRQARRRRARPTAPARRRLPVVSQQRAAAALSAPCASTPTKFRQVTSASRTARSPSTTSTFETCISLTLSLGRRGLDAGARCRLMEEQEDGV